MNRWTRYLVTVVIVAAVAASVYTGYRYRFQPEKDFRQVELAMTYGDVASLAGVEGLTPAEGMTVLKKYGLRGVVLQEPTVEELVKRGEIQVYQGRQLVALLESTNCPDWLSALQARGLLQAGRTYIVTAGKPAGEPLRVNLSAKLENTRSCVVGNNTYIISTIAPYETLKDLGTGFPPAALKDIQTAELDVFLQVRNWPGADQESIRQVFASYRHLPGLAGIMFNDDIVPGYPGAIRETARQVKALGVPVIDIEFYNQVGLKKMGLLLDGNIVRLHTLNEKDQKSLSPPESFGRYVLAAAERNQRMLLVRPVATSKSLSGAINSLGVINKRLVNEGLKVGQAATLPPVSTPPLLIFVVGLGVIAGGMLLLESLGWRLGLPGLGLLGLAGWAGLLYLDPTTARKVMALASVLVFPTLAVVNGVKTEGAAPARALAAFLKMSAVSLLGALFMVGLLADSIFMLKLNQFTGVKLAHILPLVVVLVYFVLRKAAGNTVQEKVEGLMKRPLEVGIALVALLLAVAVAIYVVRTGNEGMPVSGLELHFRSILDQLLGVRPRTKEFLLGHPAMVLLLMYGYKDNRFCPLLLLGVIGQVSMVNTFAHIHTPLLVSLLRTFNGLWLGVVIGLAAYLAITVAGHLWERKTYAASTD